MAAFDIDCLAGRTRGHCASAFRLRLTMVMSCTARLRSPSTAPLPTWLRRSSCPPQSS